MIYSHRISLSRRQTDGDMGSAEKISLSGRRATDRCELSSREEGLVDPRALSCWCFVKNYLRPSGRTGITSIAVRGWHYNHGNKFRRLFKESIEFCHSLNPAVKILSSNAHLP